LVGESIREGSVGCVEVLDWSVGGTRPEPDFLGGGGAGKVAFENFSFSKFLDSSSEDFLRNMSQGTFFANLEFKEFRDCQACPTTEPYLTIELGDVLVVGQRLTGASDAIPSEVVDLSFRTVKLCYRTTNQQGELQAKQCFGWNVSANTALP
jgi:type VI secretion system secreted protein Hcp